MKYCVGFAALVMAIASTVGAEPARQSGPDDEAATKQTSNEDAIRRNARLFIDAFNSADAGGIGALFTESAEYVTADTPPCSIPGARP